MIFSRACSIALACGLLLSAAAASAASQHAAKAETPPASDQSEPQPAPGTAGTAEREEAAEPERICRHVRLDMSSRRKTKVCRTVEEWRELNNIR